MTAMALAYLDACGDRFVHSSTYLNSAVDYEDAGSLATVFADPADAREPEPPHGDATATSPGKDIAHTFDLLRANDLVFRYVVDGWLHGRAAARVRPPGVERRQHQPARASAHARVPPQGVPRERARARRVRGDGGAADDVGDRRPTPTSSPAVDDHIVPWRVSYRTTQLFKGPMRFVMTSGGHIAGIVSPPGPKVRLWTNDELPRDADEWRAGAVEHRDTWWNDWATLAGRARRRRCARRRRSAARRHPAIGRRARPVRAELTPSYRRSATCRPRWPARSCGRPTAAPASGRRSSAGRGGWRPRCRAARRPRRRRRRRRRARGASRPRG